MNSYLNYNGKIILSSNNCISPKNHISQFGLFETMRFSNGQIKNFNHHFERLSKGLNLLKIKVPDNFSTEFIKNEVEKLNAKCKFNNARLRLSVFEIEKEKNNRVTNFIIESSVLSSFPAQINKYFSATIYSDVTLAVNKFSSLKTNNRLLYQLAQKFAFENKFDEAFLLNQHGRICESTIANIFLIKNQKIFTPHISEGCIEGIMRKNIIQVLSKKGFDIKEDKIKIEDLNEADEIFISNSIINAKNIFFLNGRKLKNNYSEFLFNEINKSSDLFL